MTRAEDVQTTAQANGLLIALEDTNWLQNDDKRRTRTFVDRATRRIELSRLPRCSWYQLGCRRARKAVEAAIAARPPEQ